jgi:hypothetical protein
MPISPPTCDDIKQQLLTRSDELIDSLSTEHFEVYVWLHRQQDFRSHVFQFMFRSYYGLDGAGLSETQKQTFFDLLIRRETDLEVILKTLFDVPNLRNRHGVYYVFATKLLHTLDDSVPIYDSLIGQVIKKNVQGADYSAKLQSCHRLHEHLQNLFLCLLADPDISNLIRKVRSKFDLQTRDVSDVKVLDSLLWTLGKRL